MTRGHLHAAAAVLAALTAGCIDHPRVTAIPGEQTVDRTIVLNHHGLLLHLAMPPGPPQGPLLVYATGDGGWRGKDLSLYRQIVSWKRPVVGFSAHEYVTHFGNDTDTTTPARLARDYLAIISLAKTELHLPADHPVILIGVSRGAGLSVVAAGQRAVHRELSGVLAIALTKEEEYVRWFRRTPAARIRTDPEEPSMVEVYRYLPRLGPLPLYVIQSTHDNYLPAEKARALFGPDTNRHRFQPIESNNHNFSDAREAMYAAAREALAFLERFTKKQRPMNFFRRTPPPPPLPSGDRATNEDIHFAYRLLLRREPDAAGLAHYRQLVADGLSLHGLIRSFINSDEFRFTRDDEARPTPVDLGGYRVLIQKLDTDFGQAIYHSKQYEEHVRAAVREHLHEGDVAVDIGANIGAVALLAASIVGPGGQVHAVEPNPDNLQLLYRGIVLNGFTNVNVLPYAASNRKAVFSLMGGTSNTHLTGANTPDGGGHFVQSIVLDDVLGDLPKLNLLKMDIEGHEPQAFEGFMRTVTRHRPVLVAEWNPRCLIDLHGQDPRAYLRQIFALYPRVRAISAFHDDRVLESPDAVMTYWERRQGEVAAEKLLPPRALHFDLVVTP